MPTDPSIGVEARGSAREQDQDEEAEADDPPLPPALQPYAGLIKAMVLTAGAVTLSIVYHWCAGPVQSSERLPHWLVMFLRRLFKALT